MARRPITNRIVRFCSRKGRVRRFDWNQVNTTLGMMWEPRNITDGIVTAFDGGDWFAATDPDDNLIRVDRIEFDVDTNDPYFRDPQSNERLMGGDLFMGIAKTYSDLQLDVI